MKTKLLFLGLILFLCSFSCSKDDEPQTQSIVCGTIWRVQTLFTTATPPGFIGVAYDVNLDAPVNIGGVDYNRARFILNNVQNTPALQQFTIGNNVCQNIPLVVTTVGNINQGFYN